MWWLAAKKWLKIAAVWCRQHWRWLVLGTVAIIMYYLGHKASKAQVLQARLALDAYKKEKEVIEAAHEKEVEGIKKAQNTYNKAMAQLSQEFSSKTDTVSLKKEKKIRKLVKNAKTDPDEIDRILEEELGIKKFNGG